MKGSRYRVTSTASLDDGIVRQQFPVAKGATWRNNGSSTRNGSRFDLDDRHLSGEYGHPWGEIKNVMLWLWLRPICRGLLSQCTRACANSTSNPSGYAVGIWLPVSHAPSCIVTTNPSTAGLNPTSNYLTQLWTKCILLCHIQWFNVNMPSQWETMLQCNSVSHWLGAFTKWSLHIGANQTSWSTFNYLLI